ncbi:hypothetical protein [Flammeovirga aprica]|uniref:Uncharacterized protein n=1 Tax=Flammeovirga aprica JL-4 TaxID=694437 RepID=A0A7X9XDM4_9BACT|nr:hypothetical protein [Flammeovirga aprica]NME73002.1 hypothetical protein [Flammeovirga aprica JL-4]
MEHWSEPTYSFNYDSIHDEDNYYPEKDSVYYKFYSKKRSNTKAFLGEEIKGNKYKAIAIIIDNKKDTLVIDIDLKLLYKNKIYRLTNEGRRSLYDIMPDELKYNWNIPYYRNQGFYKDEETFYINETSD